MYTVPSLEIIRSCILPTIFSLILSLIKAPILSCKNSLTYSSASKTNIQSLVTFEIEKFLVDTKSLRHFNSYTLSVNSKIIIFVLSMEPLSSTKLATLQRQFYKFCSSLFTIIHRLIIFFSNDIYKFLLTILIILSWSKSDNES